MSDIIFSRNRSITGLYYFVSRLKFQVPNSISQVSYPKSARYIPSMLGICGVPVFCVVGPPAITSSMRSIICATSEALDIA